MVSLWREFHLLIDLLAQHIHLEGKNIYTYILIHADISNIAQILQGKSILIFFLSYLISPNP
jgi:hypothetical protein